MIDDIGIPYALSKRPRDRRGLPIPYIVFLDQEGTPHFTINDAERVAQVLKKKLCALCGKPHKLGEMWFIGGAGAAFHEYGLYADPPVHETCGRFALRVCPFIAAPNYGKRIDMKTLDPDKADALIVADNQMDTTRPPFFAFTRASGYSLVPNGPVTVYTQPRRPWRAVEYWVSGKRIERNEAEVLLKGTEYAPENLMWW